MADDGDCDGGEFALRDKYEARRVFESAIAANPDDSFSYHQLGLLLQSRWMDDAGAQRCFEKAVAVNPRNFPAYSSLGSLLTRSDPDRALECFRAALAVEPGYSRALKNMGLLYFHQRRDFAAARACFEEALAADPNNASVYAVLGLLLEQQFRDPDGAERCYDAATVADPSNPIGFMRLGVLWSRDTPRRAADVIKAKGFYEAGLRVHPRDPATLLKLGRLAEKRLDDAPLALRCYKLAVAYSLPEAADLEAEEAAAAAAAATSAGALAMGLAEPSRGGRSRGRGGRGGGRGNVPFSQLSSAEKIKLEAAQHLYQLRKAKFPEELVEAPSPPNPSSPAVPPNPTTSMTTAPQPPQDVCGTSARTADGEQCTPAPREPWDPTTPPRPSALRQPRSSASTSAAASMTATASVESMSSHQGSTETMGVAMTSTLGSGGGSSDSPSSMPPPTQGIAWEPPLPFSADDARDEGSPGAVVAVAAGGGSTTIAAATNSGADQGAGFASERSQNAPATHRPAGGGYRPQGGALLTSWGGDGLAASLRTGNTDGSTGGGGGSTHASPGFGIVGRTPPTNATSGGTAGSGRTPSQQPAVHLCPRAHELKVVTAKPRTYKPKGTWACEECHKSIGGLDLRLHGALHCPVCNYDLCKACSRRPRKTHVYAQAPVLVGRGTFGDVYKEYDAALGCYVAVKHIRRSAVPPPRPGARNRRPNGDGGDGAGGDAEVRREVALLERFRHHPNVVTVLRLDETPNELCVVFELMAATLSSEAKRRGAFAEGDARVAMREALQGLCALHEAQPQVLHRDIKPDNLLVSGGGHVKLSDFGLSKRVTDHATAAQTLGMKGTPVFLAPECFQCPPRWSAAADVWALACTWVSILTGRGPWHGTVLQGAALETICFRLHDDPALCPLVPPFVSSEAAALIRACFRRDRKSRPTARALLDAAYFDLARPLPPDAECDEAFAARVRLLRGGSGSGGRGANAAHREAAGTPLSSTTGGLATLAADLVGTDSSCYPSAAEDASTAASTPGSHLPSRYGVDTSPLVMSRAAVASIAAAMAKGVPLPPIALMPSPYFPVVGAVGGGGPQFPAMTDSPMDWGQTDAAAAAAANAAATGAAADAPKRPPITPLVDRVPLSPPTPTVPLMCVAAVRAPTTTTPMAGTTTKAVKTTPLFSGAAGDESTFGHRADDAFFEANEATGFVAVDIRAAGDETAPTVHDASVGLRSEHDPPEEREPLQPRREEERFDWPAVAPDAFLRGAVARFASRWSGAGQSDGSFWERYGPVVGLLVTLSLFIILF